MATLHHSSAFKLPPGIRISTVKAGVIDLCALQHAKEVVPAPIKQITMTQKIVRLTHIPAKPDVKQLVSPKPIIPNCSQCSDQNCNGHQKDKVNHNFIYPTCHKCWVELPQLYDFCLRIDAFERKFLCIKCSEQEERRCLLKSEKNICTHIAATTIQINETQSKITKLKIKKASLERSTGWSDADDDDDDDDGMFCCAWCTELFESDELLHAHNEDAHHRQKSIACRVCDMVCKTYKQRQDHERSDHMCPKTGHFRCPKCPKVFQKIESIGCHIFLLHKGQRPVTCGVCGKLFDTVSHLNNHMRSHRGDRKHICLTCGKGFLFNHTLIRHMVLHTDQRPYACDQCDKKYRDLSDLRRHRYSHGGYEKTFECALCPRAFYENKSLRYHMKSHNENGVKCASKQN